MPSEAFTTVITLIRGAFADAPISGTFDESRARLDSLGAIFTLPDGVNVTPEVIAGVPCERFHPDSASGDGLVLYHHGGAYTAGSLVSHRGMTGRVAQQCGSDLVAVDYRLAPEHPFPAGLHDAQAVYRQLLREGAAPGRLVLGGDSAGGGLTTALLLSLRDEGDALPAGAFLLSPWLDLTLTADAVTRLAAVDPMLQAESLAHSAAAYGGDELRRPLVSPVFADPNGLPPLLILAGTAEILLDDSRTFAARAGAAGVDVELVVAEDMIHVWPYLEGVPEADAAMERIASWVRRHLA